MGLYTVLKPRSKGENTNITRKTISILFFSKVIRNFFERLQIFSGEISWDNMRSDLAVKWLSLISMKYEQVSKICSIVGLSKVLFIHRNYKLNK